MEARDESEKKVTTVERKSDRELVVTRTINGPAHLVYEAWTNPELFGKWWLPKSFGMTLLSCEMDARVGGGYRLVIRHGDREPMAFFGKYLEVVPNARLVWTNDEDPDGGPVTTATFEEKDGRTLVVVTDLYRSKEAREAAMTSGEKSGMEETFSQLDEMLAAAAVA